MNLAKVLLYYDMEQEPMDRIQVVTGGRDWDDADELLVDSELLIPFLSWEVTEMRGEHSFIDGSPVIRVAIEQRSNANTMEKRRRILRQIGRPSRNAGPFFDFPKI